VQRAKPMKASLRALEAWRGLSCAASLLAIALTLWPKPVTEARPHAVVPPRVAQNEPAAPDPPETLSSVHALAENGDQAALDSLIAISQRGTTQVASAALKTGARKSRKSMSGSASVRCLRAKTTPNARPATSEVTGNQPQPSWA